MCLYVLMLKKHWSNYKGTIPTSRAINNDNLKFTSHYTTLWRAHYIFALQINFCNNILRHKKSLMFYIWRWMTPILIAFRLLNMVLWYFTDLTLAHVINVDVQIIFLDLSNIMILAEYTLQVTFYILVVLRGSLHKIKIQNNKNNIISMYDSRMLASSFCEREYNWPCFKSHMVH